MKHIGIMGGTFDPIHFGHLLMAEQAREQHSLDEIMFLPAGDPPHKEGHPITPARVRQKMVELAIGENPHFYCSTMEIDRKGPSYTAKTLWELHESHPENVYYFLVGADSLDYMDRWYHPQDIFRLAVILVAERKTISEEELERKSAQLSRRYPADIRRIKLPLVEFSSTDIRLRASRGESIRYFVPSSVEEYIMYRGIYSGKLT